MIQTGSSLGMHNNSCLSINTVSYSKYGAKRVSQYTGRPVDTDRSVLHDKFV